MMMSESEKKQLDENCLLTREIYKAVVGDPTMGRAGIVSSLKKAHERMDDHEKEDRIAFEDVRTSIRTVGDKVTKILYCFGGAMAAVKLGGWIYDANKGIHGS